MGADQTIYDQALQGSDINPGIPPVLAALLVAQAKYETGGFTSNFFRNYNNAFGYSYSPSSIYQTGQGTNADNGLPIAAYNSIQDSTKEIIDWIYRRRNEGKFPADLSKITTPDQYALLLKTAGYYGDTLSNYTAGLKRYFSYVITNLQKPGAGVVIGVAFIIASIIYYLRKR